MNEQFWQEFYTREHTLAPSPFAQWAAFQDKTIFDLGCGNGRDTFYLAQRNKVTGVDLCAPSTELFVRNSIENFISLDSKADIAYCRFLFHSIEPDLERRILFWIKRNNMTLYAEFRSDKDHPTPDHQRRLINGSNFLKQLLSLNFEVHFYQEAQGLAIFHHEDPFIIRIIAR